MRRRDTGRACRKRMEGEGEGAVERGGKEVIPVQAGTGVKGRANAI